MKENTRLLRYLIQKKCILFSKRGFTSKWGDHFSFETDIRPAFLTMSDSKKSARLIYERIRKAIPSFDGFIGVPETGTLLAFFLNIEHARNVSADIPVNMLRSKPKLYQGVTAYSVQPLSKKARFVLIEDDVVTGKTLRTYAKTLHTLGIKHLQIVSIIDRLQKDRHGRTVQRQMKEDFGYRYHTLITLDDIQSELPKRGYES